METSIKLKSAPRDVFLHLLSIVTLYASATAFLTLSFQLINLWFPDVLDFGGYYAYAGARNAIRWSLASLVVIFPVYFFTARFLRKEYEAEPEKRELRVRKWLISFTLFVVALTLIGDLVSLLSHFLEGELTTRFVLKVLVVAFMAGAVGAYYLWILKARPVRPGAKYTASGILLIVLAAVVAGFWHAGSPAAERLRKFDGQRVNDLQLLQSQILTYWQTKEELPEDIQVLTDNLRGFMVPNDPETGAAYEYRATEALSFELCATFAWKSDFGSTPYMPGYRGLEAYGWEHEAGRWCFSRTIDSDFYPKLSR